MLSLKDTNKVLCESLIEVLSTQMVVATSCINFYDPVVNDKHLHVKASPAKVIHE